MFKNKATNPKSISTICKKCGEPLRSTNRRALCENCRRKRAKAFRETVGAALAVAAIIPGVKHFIGKQ